MDFKDLRDASNSNGAPPDSHVDAPPPHRKRVSPMVVGLSVLCGVLLVALTAVTTIMVIGNNDYASHHQSNTEILATYVPAPALDWQGIIQHSVEHISSILDGGAYGTGTTVIVPGAMPSDFPGGPIFGSDFMMMVERDIARNFLYDTIETSWHGVDWRLIDNLVRFATGMGLLDGQVYNFAWDCGHDCPLREILSNIE